MTVWLRRTGYVVNRKRVQRLMGLMGLEAIYPTPHLRQGGSTHEKYPYVLGELEVMRPHQVWATDITSIRMRSGFLSLVAIMDWCSRYVLSGRLSNTLEVAFCLEALEEALAHGRPELFNSDQGSQLTSQEFTSRLQHAAVRISMDSKGRVYDNFFVERLWRTVKDEEVYLKDYVAVPEVIAGLGDYFQFYTHERPHQALRYLTPAEVHFSRGREHTLN
jgi:putative transposase